MYESLLKKIKALQPDKGHYSHYQSFNKIGLVGQRPVEERFEIYQLEKIINKETTVLDLGSNIGCMSLHIAETAKEVYGVEFYPAFTAIANLIKKELSITNCHFHTNKFLKFTSPYEFDVILSLAVHGSSIESFKTLTETVYKKMLKENGHLVFESRSFKNKIANKKFIEYLRSVGFVIVQSGNCQCVNSYGDKKNQFRTFHILKLESK